VALLCAALTLLWWPEPPPGPTGGWLREAGLEAREAALDGLRIRYVRAGAGAPVVLLHGLASSIYTWKDVLPVLAHTNDVVALDLPGFGGSDQPLPLPGEALPRAAAGLIARLGLERPALVGHSLGGAVSVVLAARLGERASRLVLLDAAGFNLAAADRPALVRFAGSPAGKLLEVLPLRRRVLALGLRQVFFDDTLVTSERIDEYLAPLARPAAVASLRSLLRSGGRELAPAFAAAVRSVRLRTLVVWGRDDAWIPVAHAERFVAAIPGARAVVLDGCGHMPQEERPADVARLIADFLAEPDTVYAPHP
jgi:4,5:9,10-diseco-3-hydroxy-5,9,17-trioxoandrosta-1(10),2-diene-4-oate hydrolase